MTAQFDFEDATPKRRRGPVVRLLARAHRQLKAERRRSSALLDDARLAEAKFEAERVLRREAEQRVAELVAEREFVMDLRSSADGGSWLFGERPPA